MNFERAIGSLVNGTAEATHHLRDVICRNAASGPENARDAAASKVLELTPSLLAVLRQQHEAATGGRRAGGATRAEGATPGSAIEALEATVYEASELLRRVSVQTLSPNGSTAPRINAALDVLRHAPRLLEELEALAKGAR